MIFETFTDDQILMVIAHAEKNAESVKNFCVDMIGTSSGEEDIYDFFMRYYSIFLWCSAGKAELRKNKEEVNKLLDDIRNEIGLVQNLYEEDNDFKEGMNRLVSDISKESEITKELFQKKDESPWQ